MTFDEMLQFGRAMKPEARVDAVRVLSTDPRFPALLALLDSDLAAYQQSGCSQKLAAHHGPLAHCQGSVFALDAFLARLKGIAEAKAVKAPQRSHPD